MKKGLIFIALFLLFIIGISCTKPDWTIATINGDEFSNLTFKNRGLNAIVFLTPGCPLSEGSILELNRLQEKYSFKNLATFIVIPGKLFTQKEITAFINTFNITYPVLLDTSAILVAKLNASMTPEYFLVDKDMKILYQGAIDDRAFDNEYIRQSATINYADSAINQAIKGISIKIPKTKPVGCFIEL
jgi:hypothetical protein